MIRSSGSLTSFPGNRDEEHQVTDCRRARANFPYLLIAPMSGVTSTVRAERWRREWLSRPRSRRARHSSRYLQKNQIETKCAEESAAQKTGEAVCVISGLPIRQNGVRTRTLITTLISAVFYGSLCRSGPALAPISGKALGARR